ncbi:Cif family virulence factor [Flavobacterium soyangense]|uniref:hypothetical protein n=1 Tax=Flavobacterium soyangense TaxID=2023265 RepID=UPI001E405C00|nr:hypothetical protein [Flavobacterium soyangense]
MDKEQVKAEIQAIEDAFASVYNTGNVDALTYYADDTTSYFNGKLAVVGKEILERRTGQFCKKG